MTTNHHTVIATGAAANASVFNAPMSQLDTAITTSATAIAANALLAAATTAEVVAARDAHASLDTRLDFMQTVQQLAGGNLATKANGVSAAGQKVLTVDATTGFIVGAYVTYLLNGTTLEGNTIGSIQAGVSLTLGTNIGTGGVLDDSYISMISTSEYLAAQAIPHAGTLMLPQTMEYANGGRFNVRSYGASPAASAAVNAAAIQAASDAAGKTGTLFFDGIFDIGTTGITILCNVESSPSSALLYSGTGVAVTLGAGSPYDQHAVFKRVSLPMIRRANKDWGAASCGVRILDLCNSDIHIPYVYGYTYGVKLDANENHGTQFNRVFLGEILDCEHGLNLCPSGVGGWVNENTFYGGNVFHSSPTITAGTTCIELLPGGGAAPNGNSFYSVCVEDNEAEFNLLCYGSYNSWINCRWEAWGGARVKFVGIADGAGYGNVISYGVQSEQIVLTLQSGGGFEPLHNNIYTSLFSRSQGGGSTGRPVISATNTYTPGFPAIASYSFADVGDYNLDWKAALTGLGLAVRGVAHHGGKWESSASLTEEIVLSLSGVATSAPTPQLPANAIISAVVARVTETIGTATNWKLGDNVTRDRFVALSTGLAAGSTEVGLNHHNNTGVAGPVQSSLDYIVVTTDNIPTAGKIRYTVFYDIFTPPTS